MVKLLMKWIPLVIALASIGCGETISTPDPIVHVQTPAAQPTPVSSTPNTSPTPTAAPTPSTTSIRLHVIRAGDGHNVQAAEIDVDYALVGTTDVNGNLQLTVPLGRAFNLIVYHGEYVPYHGDFTLTGDGGLTIQLVSLR
jgi:hypothetical protein